MRGGRGFCNDIKRRFKPALESKQLKLENAFITKDNINEILKKYDFQGEIDLLSIDIDGNDYHVWNEISVINPRVVIVEYNSKIPPDFEWIMPYNVSHIWDGSDRQGASLKAYEKLGEMKGYQLVGTNLTGVNAFFVRNDLTNGLFAMPATAENLYNPPRWKKIKFNTSHPSKAFLGYTEKFDITDIKEKRSIKSRIKEILSGLL